MTKQELLNLVYDSDVSYNIYNTISNYIDDAIAEYVKNNC